MECFAGFSSQVRLTPRKSKLTQPSVPKAASDKEPRRAPQGPQREGLGEITRRAMRRHKRAQTGESAWLRHLRKAAEHSSEDRQKKYDNVDWLDHLVADIWPRVSEYVRSLVMESIEPAINRALPTFLQGSVRFEEVSLGQTPPTFGPLTVWSSEDKNVVEIRLGVLLASDVRASLSAVGVYLGISRLKIEGEVSVVFRPSLSRPPFFGGLEVYLIDPPTLELAFQGSGKIADTEMLKPIVRSAIANAVSRLMVLPNRIAVDLNAEDDVDIADLKYVDPEAILKLTLIKAEGLPISDFSILGPGSSDPYVVITLGATRWTSKVVEQNLNPVWREEVDLPIHSSAQHVNFEVFDQDKYSRDDLIGVASQVPLDQLVSEGCRLNLRHPEDDRHAGRLFLSGSFFGLTKDSNVQRPVWGAAAYLGVKIREVRGLPNTNDIPYRFKVTCGGVEGMTKFSYRPADRKVSYELQELCKSMLHTGYARQMVASILGLETDQIDTVLLGSDLGDEGLKEAVQQRLKIRAATNPQFEEVVQLLISDPRIIPRPVVDLQLLDKKGVVVGSARTDLTEVLRSPDLKTTATFKLQPVGAQIVGGFSLHFLQEEECLSASRTRPDGLDTI